MFRNILNSPPRLGITMHAIECTQMHIGEELQKWIEEEVGTDVDALQNDHWRRRNGNTFTQNEQREITRVIWMIAQRRKKKEEDIRKRKWADFSVGEQTVFVDQTLHEEEIPSDTEDEEEEHLVETEEEEEEDLEIMADTDFIEEQILEQAPPKAHPKAAIKSPLLQQIIPQQPEVAEADVPIADIERGVGPAVFGPYKAWDIVYLF